jgi:tRNA(His) guanylyltransferase
MNYAAAHVMKEFTDIVLAYGQSDEYSFVFHKTTALYNRRSAKIMSNVNSLFTSAYVYNWDRWFQDKALKYTPSFDARIVLYPNDQTIKDYLSWRQADVHINNLYNTAFWNLVLQANFTNVEAEARLRGTLSSEKNELLFSEFDINYNNLPPMYRKGTILLRKNIPIPNHVGKDEQQKPKTRQLIVPIYDDLIKEKFWEVNSEILDKSKPKDYQFPMHIGEFEPVYPEIVLEQIRKLKLS